MDRIEHRDELGVEIHRISFDEGQRVVRTRDDIDSDHIEARTLIADARAAGAAEEVQQQRLSAAQLSAGRLAERTPPPLKRVLRSRVEAVQNVGYASMDGFVQHITSSARSEQQANGSVNRWRERRAGFWTFPASATKPETSWTYEGGVRFHRELAFGPLTGFDGQASYHHVDYSNRLLGISPTAAISGVAGIVSGAAIVQNVGSVTTDGADVAGTFRFGRCFSLYDAVSYNNSRYNGNYQSGTATVLTAGRKVPGSPDWLNKTVATVDVNPFEVQLVGDYIGRRYATYTNDLFAVGDGLAKVPGYSTLSGRVAVDLKVPGVSFVRTATLSLNVTNITGRQAASTLSIGAASGTYSFFPVRRGSISGRCGWGYEGPHTLPMLDHLWSKLFHARRFPRQPPSVGLRAPADPRGTNAT